MIFCSTARTLLASVLAVGLLAAPAAAGKKERREKEDLINVLLSPRLAQWLVGPIATIATDKEVEAYLQLSDDAAAEAFILDFWQRRVDPGNPWPGRQVKDLYDQRAERADRLFTEGASPGRRTDRGAIYILFGEPNDTGFVKDEGRKATVEVWAYDPKQRIGLHGARPRARYYFSKQDGVTSFTGVPRVLESTRRP